MSCCCKNNGFMDELTEQERQLLFIDCYSHSILNKYIDKGIINIIEKYIEKDFEILTLNEQKQKIKQKRKETRKEEFEEIKRKCYNRLDRINDYIVSATENIGIYLVLIYVIKILMNIAFLVISSIHLTTNNCNKKPMNPVLYLFIGNIMPVISLVFKFISICIAYRIEDTMYASTIGEGILVMVMRFFLLEHICIFIWIIFGIIMKSIQYKCNKPIIDVSIITYIIIESLLVLPSYIGHRFIGVIFYYYNYHGW